MNTIPFVGNLAILETRSGNTDLPVANGHVFGYCLSQEDIAALDALKVGEPTTFKRADGSEGKRQSFGVVSCTLEQCDEIQDGDSAIPVYKFATPPVRAEDRAAKHFFG